MLLRVLLAASGLLALWLLIAAGITGVGLAVRTRLAPRTPLSSRALASSFWMGFVAIVLVAQLWHLVAPIDAVALAATSAIAVFGFVVHASALREWLRGLDRRRGAFAAGAIVLLGLWAAHRATAAVANFDTYMYHIPTVEWYRQHGIVPGLANLHGRFGFNNANFLFAALLESGPVPTDSTRLQNGVLLLGFLFHVASRLSRWSAGRIPAAPAIFDLALLAPALAIVNDAPLFAGLTPGVPASFAMFAGASILFAAVYGVPHGRDERAGALVVGAALFATAAAIKLNVAATAVLCWILVLVLLWRLRKHDDVPRAAMPAAIALSIAIGAAWVLRGWIQSGYPLYPETITVLHADWRVPIEQARAELDWIRVFGRYAADPATYNGSAWRELTCAPTAWLRPWASSLLELRDLWAVVVPLVVAGAAGLLGARASARRPRIAFAWWLVAPIAAGVAVWWSVAPRPLFGFSVFWLAAALFGAQAAAGIRPTRAFAALAASFIAVVGALPLLGAGLEAARATDDSNLVAAASVWFVRPAPGQLVQPTRWDYPLTSYRTDSGLSILVPQGHRCGRADLPCTSHPARNLQLRRAGDLGAGFRAPGAWQAERWPNPWADFLTDWRRGDSCTAVAPERRSG